MAAQTLCATAVIDQMHYGIPLCHASFKIFYSNESRNLNSHFLSLSVTVNCHKVIFNNISN